MNVFDFDGTIYKGDSSIDFFIFCLKRKPYIICTIPGFCVAVLRYKLHKISKEEMKESYFSFLKFFTDIDTVIEDFWRHYEKNIKNYYREIRKDDDIIISASPEFLLQPICSMLNVRLIATKVDPKTGIFLSKNCYGEEKVKRMKAYTMEEIDDFYSDSLSDRPLRKLSKRGFLVRKNQCIQWAE